MKNLIKHWANLYMESIDPEYQSYNENNNKGLHPSDGYSRQDDFDMAADDYEEIEDEKKKLARKLSLSNRRMNEEDRQEEIDEVMSPLDIIKKAEQKKSLDVKSSIKSIKIVENRPDDGYVFAEVTLQNGQKQEVEMEISKEDSKKEFNRLESLYRKEFKTEIPEESIDKIDGSVEDETDDDSFDITDKEGKRTYLGIISLIRQEVIKDPSEKANIDWLVPAPDFDKVSYARGEEGRKERNADLGITNKDDDDDDLEDDEEDDEETRKEKAKKRQEKLDKMDREERAAFNKRNTFDKEIEDAPEDDDLGPERDSSEDHEHDNDEDAFKDQENPDDYGI